MPKINDNPIRLHRLRAGNMGQKALAERSGLARSTIVAIEEGRTREPEDATLADIAEVLGVAPGRLKAEMAAWNTRRAQTMPELSPRAAAILRLSPSEVTRSFTSFAAWREQVAGSAVAFAQMLGLNHSTLTAYERGIRRRPGIPPVIASKIMDRLGVDIDYVIALQGLQPQDEED